MPGALHEPAAYSLLIENLRTYGDKVHPVALPSVGKNPTTFPKSGLEDVAAVRSVIEACVERGEDVLVLMHSLGSVIGSEACRGLAKRDREEEGKRGGVARLVFLCGALVPEGRHVGRFMEGRVGGMGTYIVYDAVDNAFLADVDQAAAYWWHDVSDARVEEQKRLLRDVKMSPGIVDFETRYAAWKWIPGTYVFTEEDRSFLPEVQEWLVQQDGVEGMDVVKIRAGHAPWLSRMVEVVEVVRRAAGEVV